MLTVLFFSVQIIHQQRNTTLRKLTKTVIRDTLHYNRMNYNTEVLKVILNYNYLKQQSFSFHAKSFLLIYSTGTCPQNIHVFQFKIKNMTCYMVIGDSPVKSVIQTIFQYPVTIAAKGGLRASKVARMFSLKIRTLFFHFTGRKLNQL